jgi:hypothetical protein
MAITTKLTKLVLSLTLSRSCAVCCLLLLCVAGIVAKIVPTEQGVDVQLISDGSGAGRGGGEKKDVLPPLMPGLKARQQ